MLDPSFSEGCMKLSKLAILFLGVFLFSKGDAMEIVEKEKVEVLSLDIVSYEDFISEEPLAIEIIRKALHEKGVVGIRGIPEYKEKVFEFIQRAREFSALPEEVKKAYVPDRDVTSLGYEQGREKFKRPDGTWVIDDLKVSYYSLVPDCKENVWPKEVNLRTPFEELGALMSDVGTMVMKKIGLIGEATGISIDGAPRCGRMLYYRKSTDSSVDNPLWCGAHFDHGMFTALIPAFYFENNEPIPEPYEAGLFVRAANDAVFKKVASDDPEVLMFQVGEFGQLVTNDAIRATEHRVQKAGGCVERYSMALFFNVPDTTVIRSDSILTSDSRYGGKGGSCSFKRWHDESYKRYLAKDEK